MGDAADLTRFGSGAGGGLWDVEPSLEPSAGGRFFAGLTSGTVSG